MSKSRCVVSLLLVFFAVSILPAKSPKIETVKNVDLDRYCGTWYEIARIPNKHEKDMVEVTSTLKKVGKDRYMLISSGYKGSRSGKRSTMKATVNIPDKNNTGNLKMKVFLFTVDFQIIDIDRKNYNYALVTSDKGKNLWIYSKSPVMNPADYERLVRSAGRKGFDVASLEKVTQTSNSAVVKR